MAPNNRSQSYSFKNNTCHFELYFPEKLLLKNKGQSKSFLKPLKQMWRYTVCALLMVTVALGYPSAWQQREVIVVCTLQMSQREEWGLWRTEEFMTGLCKSWLCHDSIVAILKNTHTQWSGSCFFLVSLIPNWQLVCFVSKSAKSVSMRFSSHDICLDY